MQLTVCIGTIRLRKKTDQDLMYTAINKWTTNRPYWSKVSGWGKGKGNEI